MDWNLQNYLTAVTTTAILCAVVQILTDKTIQKHTISMFCGVILLSVVLLPLKRGLQKLSSVEFHIEEEWSVLSDTMNAESRKGTEQTREAVAQAAAECVRIRCEAVTGGNVAVRVRLDEALLPQSAEITASETYRTVLCALSAELLDLPENQITFIVQENST